MDLDKEIDSQMLLFDEYMEKWDKTPFIPVSEIIETGLFENIGEIEVFFFSFDGEYYSTDVALMKYLGRVYTDYLDKKILIDYSIVKKIRKLLCFLIFYDYIYLVYWRGYFYGR